MPTVPEVVVGATRKDLYITFLDANGAAINITGATSLKLQGQSEDLPSKDLDVAGTIFDAASGSAKWSSIGSLITTGDLGSKTSATYTLRGKLTDAAGKIDYTPAFQIMWVAPPI